MSKVRIQLSAALVARYKQLRARLTARLGSPDLAGEALHEMWLNLQDGGDLTPVEDEEAYLYRATLHAATRLNAKHRRMLGAVEIEAILDLADDAPDAERVVIGKDEVMHLRRALQTLPPRQRDIFLQTYAGRQSLEALAKRHGVSVRLIQMELRHAILHCASRTARRGLFAPGAFRVSRE